MMATSNDSEVGELAEQWLDACRNKDIDRLMSLYADDIVYFDVAPPPQFAGTDEVRGNFIRWFDEYDGPIGLEPHDMTIVAGDDVGFVKLRILNSGTRNNGIEGAVWVRATMCCRRSGDRWLITHEHISVPAG